jgi:heme/copper-type cytochrome/quinol oxidase subunit 2
MKRTQFQKCVLRFAGVVIAMAALFSTVRVASACPTCAEAAAANDPEHEHMVKGYFYSILFMMGVPYVVFTGFAGYMYWEVKKARARKAAEVALEAPNAAMPLTPAVTTAIPMTEESRELVEA